MAAEWIPIYHGLPRRQEVCLIAADTGRSRHEVLGLLLEFWLWMDSESRDGHVTGMGQEHLPAIIGGDDAFWTAVKVRGWLENGDGGIRVPHWDLRCRGSRKIREEQVLRKRASRRKQADESRDKSVTVTEMSRDKSVTSLATSTGTSTGTGRGGGISSSSRKKEQTRGQSAADFIAEVDAIVEEVCAEDGRRASLADRHNGLATACGLRRDQTVRDVAAVLRARLRARRAADYADRDDDEARALRREVGDE